MKKIIILGILLIVLAATMCYSTDISYNDVIEDIEKHPRFRYTIGPLPYFNDRKNEIERFYNFVEILHSIKKTHYIDSNRCEQNKISIKLGFFKNNFRKLKDFVHYASKFNIMVGFSSMGREDRMDELNTYIKLLGYGYRNIFITLATYHSDIGERVDTVLKHNGTVRLVKGWYKDGDVKDWGEVSANYLDNAKKLVESGRFHILATHDFKILRQLYTLYGERMDNIEVIFFRFSKDFVYKQLEEFPFVIKNISFYKPYGRACMSLFYSLKKMDIWRHIQRQYMSLKY